MNEWVSIKDAQPEMKKMAKLIHEGVEYLGWRQGEICIYDDERKYWFVVLTPDGNEPFFYSNAIDQWKEVTIT